MISVSEKAVLRVSDLLDWIDDSGHKIAWDRGVLGVCHKDVSEASTIDANDASDANGDANDADAAKKKVKRLVLNQALFL